MKFNCICEIYLLKNIKFKPKRKGVYVLAKLHHYKAALLCLLCFVIMFSFSHSNSHVKPRWNWLGN